MADIGKMLNIGADNRSTPTTQYEKCCRKKKNDICHLNLNAKFEQTHWLVEIVKWNNFLTEQFNIPEKIVLSQTCLTWFS